MTNESDKVTTEHVDLEAYFNAVRELYAAHDAEFNECSECGRVMANDECGDEFPKERVCDECAGYCEVTKNKFAIVDKDGSHVAGSIAPTESYEGQYAYPLIMGTKSEQKLYPTRKAAQHELNRTCSLGSFRIVAA